MCSAGRSLVIAGVLLAASSPACGQTAPAGAEFFEKEVRPLLVEHCFGCHDTKKTKGGLRLTSRADMMRGGETGPAVVPGKPDESLLVQAVRHKADLHMPPKGRLKDSQVEVLARWVGMGAPWPGSEESTATVPSRPFQITEAQRRHWSVQPLRAVQPPDVKTQPQPTTAIDRFVLAALEARGLQPLPAADRRTLVRRATFDLTGLPPTPDEMEAALGDNSANWFEKVVDRLLTSPAYGERWGRHWLDVVRYADTAGETADFPVAHAWRYRNYVINAFNRDKPYDVFLREQLAGDILAGQLPPDANPERYAELITATGYLAIARRFGFDISADHHLTIDDTLDTLGKSVLGLTVGCARCHDHKYDPISSADYYALYGIFDSTRYPFSGCEKTSRPRDLVPLLPPARLKQFVAEVVTPFEAELAPFSEAVKRLEAARAALEKDLKAIPAGAEAQQRRADLQEKLKALDGELAEARARRDAVAVKRPVIELAYAVAEGKPHNARLQRRGDPQTLGEEVPRRFLQVLGGTLVPAGAGSGRFELASWLTDPKNPLTARVMVNRIWQGHFGEGLVRTPNDFGLRGEPPTHPELLDYLATQFVQSSWSVKALHRLIMLTDAYRRSSRTDAKNAERDPGNTLCWRFNRRRLSAEEIRDGMLAISGDLDRSAGGPHPFPAESSWGFTQHRPFAAVYDHKRRSVYLMTQRIKRHPFLALFDGPDTSASTGQRYTTTVPTQALFFMNDPFVHTCSERFAQRLLQLADNPARLDRASRLLYGRSPSAKETQAATRFLEDHAAERTDGPAAQRERAAWAAWLRVMLCSNEFVYVD